MEGNSEERARPRTSPIAYAVAKKVDEVEVLDPGVGKRCIQGLATNRVSLALRQRIAQRFGKRHAEQATAADVAFSARLAAEIDVKLAMNGSTRRFCLWRWRTAGVRVTIEAGFSPMGGDAMAGIRRWGWLGIAVVLAVGSTLTVAAQSAGAGATDTPVPWVSLARSARASLIAGAHAAPAAAPNLATAPTLSTVVQDPAGDVPLPQGDITAVGYGHNSHAFAFSVNIKSPVNPKTDPVWQAGGAIAGWALDTNGDGNPEYIVIMLGDGSGHVFAGLLNPTSSAQPCNGAVSYLPGVGYRVDFGLSCGSQIHHFQLQAAAIYDPNPNDQNPPTDFAPDHSFSGTLALAVAHSGYWLLGAKGQVHAFGLAHAFSGEVFGAVAIAAKRDGTGYWIIDRRGGVHPFGNATNHGVNPLLQPGEFITAGAATASGNGYWLFSNLGRAFAFGDAHSYGDMSGVQLRGPIVDGISTPSGHGYMMVGSDGGVFTFGDAHFRGSLGHTHLNGPIVDMAVSSDGSGYWLFASDGGVFSFHAPFRGSLGGVRLNQPIVAGDAIGNGYLMAASDGGVFDFSDQPFAGSLGGKPLRSPIIDIAAFTK